MRENSHREFACTSTVHLNATPSESMDEKMKINWLNDEITKVLDSNEPITFFKLRLILVKSRQQKIVVQIW